MRGFVQRLVSKTLTQFAGSGVSIDDAGRLCLPDGLDADRVHRFIEIVSEQSYDNPKAAMHDLFERVGVASSAVDMLNDVLGDNGQLDLRALGSNPIRLSTALPKLLEIPVLFRRFLVHDLGLGDARGATLEHAVVSTRRTAAARLGCPAEWDAILARPREVGRLARPWRERCA